MAQNWLTNTLSKIRADLAKQRQVVITAPFSQCMELSSAYQIKPGQLAVMFQAAETGNITEQMMLYKRMCELDAHMFAELSKRQRAVTTVDWVLQPPIDASEAEITSTKEVESIIRAIPNWTTALFNLTDAIGKGFSAMEIEWHKRIPIGLHFVNQELFGTESVFDTQLKLRNNNGSLDDLWQYGWLLHWHPARSGYLQEQALMRVLAWTYVFKTFTTSQLNDFLDKYGLPIVIGKYRAGTTQADQKQLSKAVNNIGRDARAVIPESMLIEFEKVSTGGSRDFKNVIEYWERKQSLAILGGTLTSEAGEKGARALGDVHNDVRLELLDSDCKQIASSITRDLIIPITRLNGMFAENRMPVFSFLLKENIDKQVAIDVIERAVRSGLHVGRSWAHAFLDIPIPSSGEPVLQPPQPQQTQARLALLKTPTNDADVLDVYAAKATQASIDSTVLDSIADALDTGADDAAIEDLLTAAKIDTNSPAVTSIADAMTGAEMIGRDGA